MSKIGADHLTRRAYVYVHQSTLDQVHNYRESQRRQYALADRARELGWEDVEVIDDDLGRSGSGTKRTGFERMLGGPCGGRVGAEFCSVVGSLLIDAEGVYDPRDPNDRLLLGMRADQRDGTGKLSSPGAGRFGAEGQARRVDPARRGGLRAHSR